MNRKNLWPAAVLAAVLAAASSCGKDTTRPAPEAPALPPVQSLVVSVGPFTQASAPEPATPATQFNFNNAAVLATVVNTVVVLVLTPPALALGAAFSVTPVRQSDGSWIWIYTWTHDGDDYQVRLRGNPVADGTDWEMRVTVPGANPPIEQTLWYSGHTMDDGRTGQWILHNLLLDGFPEALKIIWNVDSETQSSLDITNILPGGADAGDRLEYEVNGTAYRMTFLDVSMDEGWEIHWDGSDGGGSLQFPGYNGGQPACWDASRQDVACPPS